MKIVAVKTTNQIMRRVIYALIPAIILSFHFFGFSVIIQLSLAITTSIIVEACIFKLRNQSIKNNLEDGSGIVTAMLLALAIPSIAPWWIIVVGVAFALIFGKHLYGGLGNNLFNPAMVGYAFLLISYPVEMTQWQNYNTFIEFNQIFANFDGISGATLLDSVKHNLAVAVDANRTYLINIAFLVGGLYLFVIRVIYWQTPVAMLLSIIIFAELLDANILLHLFSGGTMMGVFFIATDPVSSAASNVGRLIYGSLIGFLLIIIRLYGNYPDAVAFAVLMANIFVPMIDYYVRPKVFGK